MAIIYIWIVVHFVQPIDEVNCGKLARSTIVLSITSDHEVEQILNLEGT